MTHEERLALIYKPFFTERFSTSYLWGGVQLGRRDWDNQRLLDDYVIDAGGKRHHFTTDWKEVGLNVINGA